MVDRYGLEPEGPFDRSGIAADAEQTLLWRHSSQKAHHRLERPVVADVARAEHAEPATALRLRRHPSLHACPERMFLPLSAQDRAPRPSAGSAYRSDVTEMICRRKKSPRSCRDQEPRAVATPRG